MLLARFAFQARSLNHSHILSCSAVKSVSPVRESDRRSRTTLRFNAQTNPPRPQTPAASSKRLYRE